MSIQQVSDDLFAYLADHTSGARFESFAKLVFATLLGEEFVPLGGIHDGGADGSVSSYVQELKGKPSTFVQFSVTGEGSAKGKIVDTIAALRKAGRSPQQVIYVTSRALPKADLAIQEVFEEHHVLVQVRDRERVKGYINTDSKANRLFFEAFAPEISNLARAADLGLRSVSPYATDPTVYVFLNHELRDRFARDHLNDKVLDALIYWSLRDTDPDGKRLMSRDEVAYAIESIFPSARGVLLPRLNERLGELSKKDAAGAERLRYYRVSTSYCLPYDMRRTLAAESSGAVALQEAFRSSIGHRVTEESRGELNAEQVRACAELIFATVHRYFIEQGLLLAAFLERQMETLDISDQVVEDIMAKALAEIEHGVTISPAMFGVCMWVLRGVFYRSSDVERQYMAYLSRTSCLLVTLQAAPRLLEYFNQMGGNFRLLIGTDMIVKAVSERYLQREHQQVTTLLVVCKQLGAELVLTEPVLNEVFTHLHAADLEFRNHYAEQEPYLRPEDIAHCDRIMIRAYLHAKRSTGGPKSWREFVNQLADPDALRARAEGARTALRAFLVQRFSMAYVSTEELESAVPAARVAELATKLEEARHTKHADLSYNDALMVFAVYAQRNKGNEAGIYDGFGFRTWWLTKETRVLSLTGAIVQAQSGVPYIMRPEFLLNFVALAPRAAEVRKAFANLLPTTTGLQLGQHLAPEVMHSLLRDAAEWARLNPERVSFMMSERVNRLTHDRFKRYTQAVA